MTQIIGYSLVELASGTEVQTFSRLPVRVTVEGVGVCDFDQHGQIMPDADAPTHMLVERALLNDPPETRHCVAGETASFDGERVNVTREFETLPEPVPEQISDRQFAHALKLMGTISHAEAMAFVQTGTIPAALQAVIDAIPDQAQRESAELLLAGATVFERSHPMTEALRIGMGKSPAEIDDLWRQAAAL